MVGRWRATVPLALTLAGVLSARPAAAQWAQLASGTNTTGVVQRFYLNPTSCEADPCILACTSLLINSFSSTTSGSHTTYINPYILPVGRPVPLVEPLRASRLRESSLCADTALRSQLTSRPTPHTRKAVTSGSHVLEISHDLSSRDPSPKAAPATRRALRHWRRRPPTAPLTPSTRR